MAREASESAEIIQIFEISAHGMVLYEAYNRKKFTHSITLQPPVADQDCMPHMKAMHVPFHMGYGSLIPYQRL